MVQPIFSCMIVIPGPASIELGGRIAGELGLEPKPLDYRVFPDGESYIRLTSQVACETVVIVQTTAPDPDTRLMQLLLTAGTAKDFGAKRIVCVIPYLSYARQDKRFLEGEALSLDVIFRLLEAAGVDDLVVVDVHSAVSMNAIKERHDICVHNVSAMPLLAGYLERQGYDGAYSLSPDKGAVHLAEAASKVLGGGYGSFDKFRNRKTGDIEMKVKDLNIKGERAVVFDDIISSGGTMARAIEALRAQGAAKVAAACTHALFMGGAEEKIRKAGADLIVASDTVETPFSRVSVASAVAEILKGL